MSETKETNVSQEAQPRRKMPKTDAELRTEYLERKFKDKTDRQLLEEQIDMEETRSLHIKSIKNNVQFFFWLIVVGLIIWAIVLITRLIVIQ